MAWRLRRDAEADFEAISLEIARNNRTAARRWIDSLYARFRLLSEMPRIGVARADIRPDLRVSVFGNYLVLYCVVEDDVEIIRIIHGARQWEDLL